MSSRCVIEFRGLEALTEGDIAFLHDPDEMSVPDFTPTKVTLLQNKGKEQESKEKDHTVALEVLVKDAAGIHDWFRSMCYEYPDAVGTMMIAWEYADYQHLPYGLELVTSKNLETNTAWFDDEHDDTADHRVFWQVAIPQWLSFLADTKPSHDLQSLETFAALEQLLSALKSSLFRALEPHAAWVLPMTRKGRVGLHVMLKYALGEEAGQVAAAKATEADMDDLVTVWKSTEKPLLKAISFFDTEEEPLYRREMPGQSDGSFYLEFPTPDLEWWRQPHVVARMLPKWQQAAKWVWEGRK